MKSQKKSTIIAATAFFVIQSLTLAGFVMKSKYEHIFEIITITALFLIYSFLKVKYNLYIKNYITWVVIITVIGHNLIGEYFGVYLSSSIYDKVLHFFGTYAFSLFFYSIFTQLFPVACHSKARELTFIVLLGISLGTTFEIIEFLADIIQKPQVPNQDSLLDTDLDIIFNGIGALAAAFHSYIKNFTIFNRP